MKSELQFAALCEEVRERFRDAVIEFRNSGDEEAAQSYEDPSEEALLEEVLVISKRNNLRGVQTLILQKYILSGKLVPFEEDKFHVCSRGKPWDVIVEGKKYCWK